MPFHSFAISTGASRASTSYSSSQSRSPTGSSSSFSRPFAASSGLARGPRWFRRPAERKREREATALSRVNLSPAHSQGSIRAQSSLEQSLSGADWATHCWRETFRAAGSSWTTRPTTAPSCVRAWRAALRSRAVLRDHYRSTYSAPGCWRVGTSNRLELSTFARLFFQVSAPISSTFSSHRKAL